MVERDDGSKNRQSAEAYARYLAGMDASMRQKVALTAAHILSEGDVADMGMGSGEGSAALAALYPSLRVIGVDLDPEMVARASAKHVHPNLRFVTGNIAEPVFADAELEGIFDSSVLHHVTTFGAPSYDHEHAARCLAVQARALAIGGVLVVRDFLAPDAADEEVLLDLSTEDLGLPLGSEADVARRTAREWRALAAERGFPMTELEPPAPAWARFRLARRHAVEILLRKDYRDDWVEEIKEEYTYFDRARFEAVFASLGLRVLGSSPIRNPWIVRHRFEGKVALRALDGTLLDHPPTNYVIVGERVEAGASVRFRDAGEDRPRGFLEASSFEHKASGQRRDVVRRPGVVADVVPFFVHEERLYVLARTSYPRPILGTALVREPALDGSGVVPWLAEPMHVQLTDKPIAQAVEEELWKTARLSPDAILRVLAGTTYYPSPGGLQEEVRSIYVEIAPSFDDVPLVGVSPFSTSGRIRPIEAQQVLRAAQVGGLPDARLEVNVRSLLTRLGRAHGPWIADQPAAIPDAGGLAGSVASWDALARRPSRRAFRAIEGRPIDPFLALHARRFEELDAQGRVLSSAVLELVVPRTRSATSVATAAIARIDGRVCLGIDDDDFPAAQCFHGASEILVAPAWRLPREVLSGRAPIRETRAFLTERFAEEHGLEVGELVELGGRYHPSAGVTPEVVYPWLVIVRGVLDRPSARRLCFVPLDEVLRAADRIVDGHLRVVALRSASMLGLLVRAAPRSVSRRPHARDRFAAVRVRASARMRIGLYTWGSEGDVRPFVALAAGLAKRGHDVRLGYSAIDGRDWSAVCEPLGFRARAVGADAIAKARARGGPHDDALLGKGNPAKQIYDVVVGLLDPVVEAMWADAGESTSDLDVAVVHLLAHPAMTMARSRGVPVATVQPAPVTPTRELPPLGAPDVAWLRPFAWWLADRVARLWLVPRINVFRARVGLAPLTAMFASGDVALSMTCVSPTLVTRPSDWPEHEVITGFFELPGHAHAWERPEALDRFLAEGEAPWLMGFGSMLAMPGEETQYCVRTMIEAVDRAGARALVQAPWSELPAMPESPRVFRLGRAPHGEILPLCRGMVHHGGAGTTQAACLAGRPSVIVPFLGDQPFWAGRLRALGIAPAPVPRRSLDARRLAEAMKALDADLGARARAEAVGASMRAEDGVLDAVQRIERLAR